jgi:PAS domain S-box-containing protein
MFGDDVAEAARQSVLLKSGALQEAIFNSATFSGIVTDAAGVIKIFNVGAERMLGYTADEVVNVLTHDNLCDPQEVIERAAQLSAEFDEPIAPGFESLVFKASRGLEDMYELTKVRKDGSRFPAIVSVTALRDADDTIICYLVIGTDNSARKLAEEELAKAGALRSAIFNSVNFSGIATDAHGVIQIFNVGAERMLGYAAIDVVNRIIPADISDPRELIMRASGLSLELDTPINPGFEALVFKASRGIADIYELTYVRKDGSRFPAIVSVTALCDAHENIIGYLLIGTDNTARKQVEATQALLDQRLRDQQFYTRSLIESNIDALMTTDPQGIISDVNQQIIALPGRTRDELIGAPARNFFTDPVRADAAIKRVLTENKLSNYELTVRAQNGVETVVSYNAATFYDRDRNLQGVFAAARDVTEVKRFERALQETNVELEHASRMKSEVLATMSHELRTPLNAIIGFSEALKDGLMAVELEEIDVHSLLLNSLSIVRDKAAAHSIQLDVEIGDTLGVPHLDLRKTKQIVYNLLSNAVKFSHPGGRVVLRARRVPRNMVGTLAGGWPVHNFPLRQSDYEEFLEICVDDNGIGISHENMTKLFQAFIQIDSGLARRFEGTGLGLAMVKQLAELHGGSVAVSSSEGAGARFAAWLPVHRAANSEPAALSTGSGVAGSDGTGFDPTRAAVLVIEDDVPSADLARLLLEAEGYRVVVADSTESALLIAQQQPLVLITLDIRLPGVDGWEFLRRIRNDARLAHIPVVVISGVVDNTMALARGASAVLQKPIGRAVLRESLAHLGMASMPAHTHTVLVVDDDPNAVEILAAFMPSPDYAVVRAFGDSEAIALAGWVRPDLILLDLDMPGVNGFDVVAALQRNPDTATIPILVITAREVTAVDHATLTQSRGRVVHVIDKADFNRVSFIAEVKRALLTIELS